MTEVEDELFDRQEEEEEKDQTPAPNVEQEDETLAVNLMSPASQVEQNLPSGQSHHVGPTH